MLLEIAVGDAYGAGFEYSSDEIVRTLNNLTRYVKHQKHDLKPGSYTDDTQMSIAIAELLLEDKEWNPLNLANKFVEVFKRDAREGYAGRFYKFLTEIKDGTEFLAKINPASDKSGAAMRASPIGYFRNTKQVIEYSTIQAKLTHDTPLGISAAVASSLMAHYFIHDLGEKKDLQKFIESNLRGDWSKWQGSVGAQGYMSVRAAITAIQEQNSLPEIIRQCVDFRGDVDTVAAIAMGAASCSKEIKQDLPQVLIDNLENGKYGREYLLMLDEKLKSKFK